MHLDEEIDEAKAGLATITNKYAKASTFGNATEELRYDMLRMFAYIKTLERNCERTKALPINASIPEGTEIPISALKSQGNNLILDTAEFTQKFCIDYRPCLSDSDLCKIVNHVRSLVAKYNC